MKNFIILFREPDGRTAHIHQELPWSTGNTGRPGLKNAERKGG